MRSNKHKNSRAGLTLPGCFLRIEKTKQVRWNEPVLIKNANCLRVTPTHDAYLENGTLVGLTVGILMISYVKSIVNIPEKVW